MNKFKHTCRYSFLFSLTVVLSALLLGNVESASALNQVFIQVYQGSTQVKEGATTSGILKLSLLPTTPTRSPDVKSVTYIAKFRAKVAKVVLNNKIAGPDKTGEFIFTITRTPQPKEMLLLTAKQKC